MADYTPNYNLAKPEQGAEDSGTAMNGNMDTLDAELKALRDYVWGISSSSSSSSSSISSSSSSESSSSSSSSSSS